MFRSISRATSFLLFLATSGLADETVGANASAQETAGFHPLFNGKDLTGWVTPEDKSLFTVEDGEIVGRTKDRLSRRTNSWRPTRDTAISCSRPRSRFRNGNSGIQFRSERKPMTAWSRARRPTWPTISGGCSTKSEGRGILQRYPLEKAKKLLKADGWNEFVITAKGSHVTIDLNGTRIIDRDDPKFDKEGIIALQIHVWPEPMEVRFKDIEIKELDRP